MSNVELLNTIRSVVEEILDEKKRGGMMSRVFSSTILYTIVSTIFMPIGECL